MHRDHALFVRAIREERRVRLTRVCGGRTAELASVFVPIYYSRPVAGDDSDCYYLWGSNDDGDKRLLFLPPSQIVSIELTEEAFDPAECMTVETGQTD